MPEQKMLSPNTTIWFVPEAGVANYREITTAEINAGVNISCAIVAGYTLNATDSETDTSKSICDNSNVETPTFDNYEAELPLFRDADNANAISVYNLAYNLFKNVDTQGYLVRRMGKGFAAPAAVGDVVSVFGVSTDYMQSVDGGSDGSPVQATVPFLTTGKLKINYELAT